MRLNFFFHGSFSGYDHIKMDETTTFPNLMTIFTTQSCRSVLKIQVSIPSCHDCNFPRYTSKNVLRSSQSMIHQWRVCFWLLFYLDQQINGALLAPEVLGVEHPFEYFSRSLWGAEMKYSSTEYQRLTLIFTTQQLRHYFLTYPLNLLMWSNCLEDLLSLPAMIDCIARWLLQWIWHYLYNSYGATKSNHVWSFSSISL